MLHRRITSCVITRFYQALLFLLLIFPLSSSATPPHSWVFGSPEPGYKEITIPYKHNCARPDIMAGDKVSLEARIWDGDQYDIQKVLLSNDAHLVAILPSCECVVHVPDRISKIINNAQKIGTISLRLSQESDRVQDSAILALQKVQSSRATYSRVRSAENQPNIEEQRVAYCVGKHCGVAPKLPQLEDEDEADS